MPNAIRRYLLKAFLFLLLFGERSLLAQTAPDSLIQKEATVKRTLKLQWLAPVSLMGGGLAASFKNPVLDRYKVQEWRMRTAPDFHTHVDDWMPYIPAAAVYGLDWLGVKAKNDFMNRSAILFKSELIMLAMVFPVKELSHVLRPDGSTYNSFPSGHTAQAFMAAQFLHHELGDKHIAYSIAGYSIATGVGILRMMNNRHWLSDVLAGAGVGILSTEIAYATHRYKWCKKLVVMPWVGKGVGVYVNVKH